MANEAGKEKFKLNSINIIKQTISDSIMENRRLSTEFLLNLCLIDESNLEKENLLKILAILSYLCYKAHDISLHMTIMSRINNEFFSDVMYQELVLMRVFFRMGDLLYYKNHYLYGYHYLLKSKYIEEKSQVRQDSREILDTSFALTFNKLNGYHESHRRAYIDERDKASIYFKDICNIVRRIQSKTQINNNETKTYLISSKWFESLTIFLNDYLKALESKKTFDDFIKKAFDLDRININYFRDKGIQSYNSYPDKIDNFDIILFSDQWEDPLNDNSFENVILKKGLEEYRDYYCLTENEWQIIWSLFNATNKIVRYKTVNNKWEIYLEEIDIFIIEQNLKIHQQNLLKIRKIQYSNRTIMSQFIDKIRRCLKISDLNNKFYFYSVSTENKEKLVNLLIGYIMNCPKYQIPLSLLQFNLNDTVLTTIIKNKLSSFFFLLEIVNEESTPFILIDTSICAKCGKRLKNASSFQCNNCYYNYYCSISCLNSDEYHKSVHNYPYWTPQFSTIQNISWNTFIQKENNNGKTGLINVGNSCYMNSALQCLSNTEDLTKYFLSGVYRKEINTYNHLGSKGNLSNVYQEIIEQLWNTRYPYADPSKLKQELYKRTGRFGNYSMQDSQEMLSILLDHLHEDVNRINKKPCFEMVSQKANETDNEASNRWWQCHKKREDSIIVDLFHGQFKSLIACPSCKTKNISYDPFLFLNLPLPTRMNKYKYVFINLNKECLTKEIQYSSNFSISQIKLNISIAHQIRIDTVEAIVFDKEKNPIEIGRDSIMIKSIINEDKEIVFYERDNNRNQYMLYVYPVVFSKSLFSLFYSATCATFLAFPISFSINAKSTLVDLCFIVYQSIKHILLPKDLINIQEILCSENGDMNNKQSKLPFTLHFLHQVIQKAFGKSYKCYHCVDQNISYCNIFKRFDLNTPLIDIIQFSWNSPSFILAEIPVYDPSQRIFQEYDMPLGDKLSSKITTKQKDFTIQDCIELFISEEKLSKDNLWYCDICKHHREATKKCDLFKTPNYLIIHLKRFQSGCDGLMGKTKTNQKNTQKVNYPIEGLNLQEYILGPQVNNAIYDLYGVVKHIGTLNDGHYVAICKNFDQWLEYNDDKVTKVSLKNVVSENAYLLFYKKKQ